MIFFTTFILTLILSYVTRAVPACGDAAPPEELYRDEYYEPYEVTIDAQAGAIDHIWWDTKYDDPNGSVHTVTCSNLDPPYPYFINVPDYPYIGAAFDVKKGPSCSKCWKLTDVKTQKTIYLFAIDETSSGFKVGKEVYKAFTGGTMEPVQVESTAVPLTFCKYK